MPRSASAMPCAVAPRASMRTRSTSGDPGATARSESGVVTTSGPIESAARACCSRFSLVSGVSGPACVQRRAARSIRSGNRRQNAIIAYPPIEQPISVAAGALSASSAAANRRARSSIVQGRPSAGVPPKPGQSTAATRHPSAAHSAISSSQQLLSSGKGCANNAVRPGRPSARSRAGRPSKRSGTSSIVSPRPPRRRRGTCPCRRRSGPAPTSAT